MSPYSVHSLFAVGNECRLRFLISNIKDVVIMIHTRIVLLLFVSGIITTQITPAPAQTKKEVYELDFLHNQRFGNDDVLVAQYWTQMAEQELKMLEAGKRPELGNQAEVYQRLKEALAPIDELTAILSNLPRGPERDMVLDDLAKTLKSDEIAERVFEILGAEHCARLATERVSQEMEVRQADLARNVAAVRTYLADNTFAELLKLTDEQKKQIQKEIEKANKKLESTINRLLDQLHDISDRRWNAMIETLDNEQGKQATNLLGKPIEWFRTSTPPEFRNSVNGYGGLTITGRKATELNPKDGQALSDIPEPELEKHGIEFFDSLVYQMLFETSLWDEFELVDAQKEELKTEIRSRLNDNVMVAPRGAERLELLLQNKADYPKTITDLLLPTQLKWFRQMELQIRLGPEYTSTVGLTHPRIVELLRIGNKEKHELSEIGSNYEEQEKEITGKMAAERQVVQSQLIIELSKILSDEQREIYRKHTGRELTAQETDDNTKTR